MAMTNIRHSMTTRTNDADLTSESMRGVSEFLKTADNLIRRGQLDEAEVCVTTAQQMDPKNIYAYAFKERIAILKEEAIQNPTNHQRSIDAINREVCETEAALTTRSHEENASDQQEAHKSLSPVSKSQILAAAKQFTQPEFKTAEALLSEKRTIRGEVGSSLLSLSATTVAPAADTSSDFSKEIGKSRDAKIQLLVRTAIEGARHRTESKNLESQAGTSTAQQAGSLSDKQKSGCLGVLEGNLEEKIREALRRKPGSVSPDTPAVPVVEERAETRQARSPRSTTPVSDQLVDSDRTQTLSRYKFVLASVWADGAASEEEIETLEHLRQLLAITHEEHEELQKEVQMDTYVEAFKQAWNAGKISRKDVAVLAGLRERFHISMEEHLAIESRILWELQPEKDRPTLLVVDDDERLLRVVTSTLNNAGFFTTPFTTSDEALSYLKDSSPDLILCDVNLRTSSMGGFAFYEKVRELDRLQTIPFIFLSGLTDETLVKTGKELGVDDYLSKPVSEEILLATIRGKLRRYNELKERSN
jgi:CheY-like chemotaxis protein